MYVDSQLGVCHFWLEADRFTDWLVLQSHSDFSSSHTKAGSGACEAAAVSLEGPLPAAPIAGDDTDMNNDPLHVALVRLPVQIKVAHPNKQRNDTK